MSLLYLSYNESLTPVSSLTASVLKLFCGCCRYPCILYWSWKQTQLYAGRGSFYHIKLIHDHAVAIALKRRRGTALMCLVTCSAESEVYTLIQHLHQKWWLVAQVMTCSRTSGPPDVIGFKLANQLIYDNPLWVLVSYGFLVIQIVRKNKVYTRIRRSC